MQPVAARPAPSPARIAFFAWSTLLGTLAVLAAARGELGPRWLGSLVGAWCVVPTIGVFFPGLETYGPVVSHGPRGHRSVALTFDDGPHPTTTRRILALLATTNHRATFFVLGTKARLHPDVVREMHAGGHTIGLYGDRHDRLHSFRMPGLVREDLLRAARAVEDATGVRPRFFRPPLGHTSITTTRDIRRAGMIVVGWSVRGLDGLRGRRPEPVVARVTQSMTDGAIVLLHDAAEHDDFEPASVRALPELLRLLDERGWTSVGLDTPLATPSDPAAGRASSPAAHAQEASTAS
jgi:peptidoglycan/xylan/chitin deacetylase (PgdA/CDA1 family)